MPRRNRSETPSQRDYRRFMVFRDQHGRKWEGTVEDDTLCPVGELAPARNRHTGKALWNAPWLPSQKYFRFSEVEVGQFTIDYDNAIEDLENRRREWHENQLVYYAQQMYGDAWVKMIKDPPQQLLRMVGEEPPAVELLIAAKQGNRWVLGIPKEDGSPRGVPEWAKPYVEKAEKARAARSERVYEEAEEDEGEAPARRSGRKSARKRATVAPAKSRIEAAVDGDLDEELDEGWAGAEDEDEIEELEDDDFEPDFGDEEDEE